MLQAAFNYEEVGKVVACFTAAIDDRMGYGCIGSRIGLRRDAKVFDEATNFNEALVNGADCVFIDEAQFLTDNQVRQLHQLANVANVPVNCYGLRSDFLGRAFPGAAALLTLADEIEEMKSICRCLKKASMNMRIDAQGQKILQGAQINIAGNEGYRAVCPTCFYKT